MVIQEVFEMNKIRRIFSVTILLSLLFSFNGLAMINNEFKPVTPDTERSNVFKWIWLNDNECVRFNAAEAVKRSDIERKNEVVTLSHWIEPIEKGDTYQRKVRDSYSGKWSQAEDGVWSFAFDDNTIPVGVTKIDGVLYAFNTYGELKTGYEYYTGIKTEADGLVKADSAEFTQWLGTQYLPECTSHE